jgi:hypothetical protein
MILNLIGFIVGAQDEILESFEERKQQTRKTWKFAIIFEMNIWQTSSLIQFTRREKRLGFLSWVVMALSWCQLIRRGHGTMQNISGNIKWDRQTASSMGMGSGLGNPTWTGHKSRCAER